MKHTPFTFALFAAATFAIAGCSDDSESPMSESAGHHDHDHAGHDHEHDHDHADKPGAGLADTINQAAGDAEAEMEKVAGDVEKQAEGLGEQADSIVEQAKEDIDEAKTAAKPSEVDVESLDLSEGSSLNATQATAVIDKIRSLINEQNLDTAEQWLSKLDGFTLPEGFDKYVADLKGLLDKARQGSGQLEGLMSK